MTSKEKSGRAQRHKPEHAKAPYCFEEPTEGIKASRLNRHIKRTWKRVRK